jgi:hypothetical protein
MVELLPQPFVRVLLVLACAFHSVAQPLVSNNRVEVIRCLCQQLRWHDKDGQDRYERTRASVTERLLEEVDGFVADNFAPGLTTADSVRQGLDALLGHKPGDEMQDIAFAVDLAAGRFLIAGIELWRGGGALPENAISFRAYRESGGKFVPVAHSSVWDGVMDLHAKPLTAPPVPGEFWFVALGRVNPSLTPPMVAMNLWAFDGKSFRAVWTPKSITAGGPAEAVEIMTPGFIVNRLVDPTGRAARSPTLVIHEQFLLTTDGPQKIAEWETQYLGRSR